MIIQPELFSISPDTQTGSVYGTEFTFKTKLSPKYTNIAWNFGDGNIVYNKSSVTHTYNYPGLYSVGLSAWTDQNEFLTNWGSIDVDYIYRDAMEFTYIPKFGVPGIPYEAFVISITSAKIDTPLRAILQPFNTKSVPEYVIPEKWRFITPRWRFVNAYTMETLGEDLALSFSTEPVYQNSKIVATKGTASFYFVDDRSTGSNPFEDCPLVIMATLDTQHFTYPPESLVYPYASYSNNEAIKIATTWNIIDSIPTDLKVTENFINNIAPTKWSNVPIPVMVTCISDTTTSENFINGKGFLTNSLAYPRTNEIGGEFPLVLSLSSSKVGRLTENIHFSASKDLNFKATDEYNNTASGYVFTTITPLTAIPGTTVVLASTVAATEFGGGHFFKFPSNFPLYYDAYISNCELGRVTKYTITSFPKDCPAVEYTRNQGFLVEGHITSFSVPTLSTTDLVNYTLSGGNGVYGMAFNPVENILYTCDADMNYISSYSNGTTLLTSVNASDILKKENLAPSHISIDRKGNLWISLFDEHLLLKFDKNLNYVLSAYPSFDRTEEAIAMTGEYGFLLDDDGTVIRSHILDGEHTFISPPVVETDMVNNVWACYSSTLSSMLVKFDSQGNEIFRVQTLPFNSDPVCLSIDTMNGVWVACKNSNALFNYSVSGTLVETLTGFLRPSYVALDRASNVWVAHGQNLCSVYNTTSHTLSTWRISTLDNKVVPLNNYSSKDITTAYASDEIWGGLSIDVLNRVWLVDSVNNFAMLFDTKNPIDTFRTLDVQPYVNKYYRYNPRTNFVIDQSILDYDEITGRPIPYARSAQAGGDWTGNRWYQKYAGVYNEAPVLGTSAPFNVFDLERSFQAIKVNEDFDCADYYKSLALPEILNQNLSLFTFLSATVGNSNPISESVGGTTYERIANFISNNGDFETAEIDKLVSLSKAMGVEVKTFGNGFPVAINRLLNILSTPKQQLRGIPSYETDFDKNIGPLLTLNSTITANTFYIAQDRQYSNQHLIHANALNVENIEHLTYPLSSIVVEGLRQPVAKNYYFFSYNTENMNGYTGNIINWSSPYTTISYNLSTNEEWYGDGGLVETMFNNLLTKQLYLQ